MNIGRWLEEEVNFLEDYERAFNQKPPEPEELALLNASDHTGESPAPTSIGSKSSSKNKTTLEAL